MTGEATWNWSGQTYWAGDAPWNSQFLTSSELITGGGACREVPTRHGVYDSVCLQEVDLGVLKHWPVLLDEAIRLLKRDCKTNLVIRFHESLLLTHFVLANFLRNRHDVGFSIKHSSRLEDGSTIVAFDCWRNGPSASLDSLEVCVVTNGSRDEAVSALISSVGALQGSHGVRLSVALCGPERRLDLHAGSDVEVRWVPQPNEFQDVGWITKKKNLLVASSRAENLLVLHDRYQIQSDFIEKLIEFGADFDIVIPAQIDPDGGRFPDYVALPGLAHWAPPGVLDYRDYSPFVYVNGGAVLAKRSVLCTVPWNDLLFWDQGEDVEITQALIARGVIPRVAPSLQLCALTVRPGYVDSFGAIPFDRHHYTAVGGAADRIKFTGAVPGSGVVDMRGASLEALADNGVCVSANHWYPSSAGIHLAPGERGELVVDLGDSNSRALSLALRGSGRLVDVQLRGDACESVALDSTETGFVADILLRQPQRARFVRVDLAGEGVVVGGLEVNYLSEDLSPLISGMDVPITTIPRATFEVMFASGWGEVEDWGGVWAVSDCARLVIPAREQEDLPRALCIRTCAFDGLLESPVVGVSVNGVPVSNFQPQQYWDWQWFRIEFPEALVCRAVRLEIVFVSSRLSSPKDCGISEDPRSLGFALDCLRLGS